MPLFFVNHQHSFAQRLHDRRPLNDRQSVEPLAWPATDQHIGKIPREPLDRSIGIGGHANAMAIAFEQGNHLFTAVDRNKQGHRLARTRTQQVERQMLAAGQQFTHCSNRKRAREKIALNHIALVRNEHGQLFSGFHPLGDHLELEVMGHGDHGAGDRGIVGVRHDVADK